MAFDSEGRWSPDLFPKQFVGMRMCLPRQKRNIILFNGPRKSTKTICCHNCVAQHGWEVPNANIAMLCISQQAGTDSGPWQKLTEQILPEWINAEFGMEWAREPYVEGVTKKPKCKIRTPHGISTISLESLKVEDEVEERFKGKEYSMIWVNELSKFKKRKTFDTLKQCLRGFPKENLLFLADTNPCLDEGNNSWIYQLWYVARTADDETLAKMFPDIPDISLLKPLLSRLDVLEFTVDDNLSMTTEDKAELLSEFIHDPDLVQAYYYGKWVTASIGALFYQVFRPAFHVIPDKDEDPRDPEIMVPQENCSELKTGWDPGDSINSAAVICEKTYRTDIIKTKEGKEIQKEVSVFKFLDELVIVGQNHRLEDFVLEFMELMQEWERIIEKPGDTMWTHWSDRSVFARLAPESGRYLHQIIADASVMAMNRGDVLVSGPIFVEAADNQQSQGSVRQRVDLWKRLLFERRIFFSRHRTPRLIEATKGLKSGTSQIQIIQRGSPLKHVWDAASYLVSAECSEEMSRTVLDHIIATRRKSQIESGLVSVRL